MNRTFRPLKATTVPLLALLLSALWPGGSGRAAEFTVIMTADYRFDPSYLEIEVNDVVTWVNRDQIESHSSVSTEGLWDSGDLYYGETYSLQFYAPGTYPYQDYIYGPLGMTGTIVVKPAAQRPMLTAPIRLPDGRFQFSLSNLTVGASYIVQGSTNLAEWAGLATNVTAANVETWTDNGAAAITRRFYRAQLLP
jgi:plastocyanin